MNAITTIPPAAPSHNLLYRVKPERKSLPDDARPFDAQLKRVERRPIATEPAATPAQPRDAKPRSKAEEAPVEAAAPEVVEDEATEGVAAESPTQAVGTDDTDVAAEPVVEQEGISDDEPAALAEGESPEIVIAANPGATIAPIVPLDFAADAVDAQVAGDAAATPDADATAPLQTTGTIAPPAVPPSLTAAPAAPSMSSIVQDTTQVTAVAAPTSAIAAAEAEAEAADVDASAELAPASMQGVDEPAANTINQAATTKQPSALPTELIVAGNASAIIEPLSEQAAPQEAMAPVEDATVAPDADVASGAVKSDVSPAPAATAAPVHRASPELAAVPTPAPSAAESGPTATELTVARPEAREAAQSVEDRVNERINAASVARGLRNVVQQGGGSLTMRLTPHDMGTVRVQMQLVGTAVSAQFHTESEAAHAMLSQQLSQLRSTLEGQGLSVERLNVQMMPSNGSSASNGQTASGQQQSQSDPNAQQQHASDGRSRGFMGHDGGQGQGGGGRARQGSTQDAFRRLLFNQVA